LPCLIYNRTVSVVQTPRARRNHRDSHSGKFIQNSNEGSRLSGTSQSVPRKEHYRVMEAPFLRSRHSPLLPRHYRSIELCESTNKFGDCPICSRCGLSRTVRYALNCPSSVSLVTSWWRMAQNLISAQSPTVRQASSLAGPLCGVHYDDHIQETSPAYARYRGNTETSSPVNLPTNSGISSICLHAHRITWYPVNHPSSVDLVVCRIAQPLTSAQSVPQGNLP
jgi:hypothetical protein